MGYKITSLPAGCGYKLKEPIRVEVTQRETYDLYKIEVTGGTNGCYPWYAKAPDTLLFSGRAGLTPEEAIQRLTSFLIETLNDFEVNGDNLSWRSFKSTVKPRLDEHFEKYPKAV